ncbi:MAG: hypothetical protein ACJA0Y_002247 [Maricaulis maris]|jgi:hypothetical protein
MAYKHTYQIASLPRQTINGVADIITEIHVAITVSNGERDHTLQAFAYTIPEEDRQPPYAALSELSKETILSWLPADLKTRWEGTMVTELGRLIEKDEAAAKADVPDHLT